MGTRRERTVRKRADDHEPMRIRQVQFTALGGVRTGSVGTARIRARRGIFALPRRRSRVRISSSAPFLCLFSGCAGCYSRTFPTSRNAHSRISASVARASAVAGMRACQIVSSVSTARTVNIADALPGSSSVTVCRRTTVISAIIRSNRPRSASSSSPTRCQSQPSSGVVGPVAGARKAPSKMRSASSRMGAVARRTVVLLVAVY